MQKIHPAFTLAEILIVIAIIGIVAAITIPALIQQTQNQEYVTALKKFYSEANQALIQVANDYGCSGDLSCTGIFDSGGVENSVSAVKAGSVITQYFKIVKNCGTNQNQGCFANSYIENFDNSNKPPGSTIIIDDKTWCYKAVTADGMSLAIESNGVNCPIDATKSASGNGPLSQICGSIGIDVNGLKGPNQAGRDLYYFYIISSRQGIGLYPAYGGKDDNTTPYWKDHNLCSQNGSYQAGLYCAARIIEEGWQMNY